MPTPTYVPLATITLSSASATVTFSSIPASYRDLIVVANGFTTGSQETVFLRLNGATTSYSNVQMTGSSIFTRSAVDGTNGIYPGYFAQWSYRQSGVFGYGMLRSQIMDYSATDKHKTVLSRIDQITLGSYTATDAGVGRWASNAAVNQVSLHLASTKLYAIGSTFSLYGIA